MTLIRIFMLGPDVSFNGSSTVSPYNIPGTYMVRPASHQSEVLGSLGLVPGAARTDAPY